MRDIKDLIKRIGIFVSAVIFMGICDFPMAMYEQMNDSSTFGFLWVYLNFFMVIGLILFIKRYESKIVYGEKDWFEKPKEFNYKWILILFFCFLIFEFYSIFESAIVEILNLGESENQEFIEEIIDDFSTPVWINFNIALQAPIVEEFIFRKLFNLLFFRKNTSKDNVLSVLISSMIFGFMHANIFSWYFILYSLSGLVLAIIYRYTKDIRFSILVHGMNNFMSLF